MVISLVAPRLAYALGMGMALDALAESEGQFELPGEACAVTGDEGQLAQVFQNLVRNAVEAMPGGGVVGVKMSRQSGVHGNEVCIEVSDHGRGIEPESLEKIFTPFFTTKDKGSGLWRWRFPSCRTTGATSRSPRSSGSEPRSA